ncbi:MAG: aryl-sulfate sulfotransferase [Planctomycetota bacterium]|jgi:hypothetical protein|nr:aryl-sulfate sulfotransferase [Planctomycetota bacterium]MDP6763733.1 aryl-sulfate sulfotransferase [Planctomycetota bacterium]MDP6989241.1 aryl-sulfate sulfotransferase [Planctomycetota bacterium]
MNRLPVIATALLISVAGAAASTAATPQAPGGGTRAQRPTLYVDQPTLLPNPNPAVPLAALITFETSVPTRTDLAFKEGDRSWVVRVEPGFGLIHRVPVLGVRPGSRCWITVWSEKPNGERVAAEEPVLFETPPLPEGFPPIVPSVSDPEDMEPGVTLVNVNASRYQESYLVMLDSESEVVWYYRVMQYLGDVQRLRNGNLLYMYDRTTLAEIDMFGNVVQEWFAAGINAKNASPDATLVDVNVFHHDVIELPVSLEGDFMALSTELRVYPSYPADEVDENTSVPHAEVVGDIVVEFQRDGTIVNEWPLLDILDPYRVCYDSLSDTWGMTYQTVTRDWSHGNSVFYDAGDGSWIYSARHQEAIVKVGRSDGEVKWILSPHGRWNGPLADKLLRPIGGGPFSWSYHQHAPEITPAGTLMLFDNGNHRAVPPDPPQPDGLLYSRAVEYEIDEVEKTVRQVWEYSGQAGDVWYSSAYGDADALPQTGNVLVTDGARKANGQFPRAHVRLVEVTRDETPRIVWEMRFADTAPFGNSWSAYRAERLDSVYP